MKNYLRTAFGNDTSVGMVRREQQDYFGSASTSAGQQLFLVCDGMGGHKAGNKASVLAVTGITEFVKNASSGEDPETLLRNAFNAAGEAIVTLSRSDERYEGMGTTCVALLLSFSEQKAWIANVGDSRAYLLRRGRIERLTTDHSRVQEMVAHGLITEEQAREHPDRNVITRALGAGQSGEPDIRKLEITDSDRFILCTDGVSGYFTDSEFDSLAGSGEPQAAASKLVQEANARGGEDNSTAMVIDILPYRGSLSRKTSKGRSKKLRLLPAGIIICGLAFLFSKFVDIPHDDDLDSAPIVTSAITINAGVTISLVKGNYSDSLVISDIDSLKFVRVDFESGQTVVAVDGNTIDSGSIFRAGELQGELAFEVSADSSWILIEEVTPVPVSVGELTSVTQNTVYEMSIPDETQNCLLWVFGDSVEGAFDVFYSEAVDRVSVPGNSTFSFVPETYTILPPGGAESFCFCRHLALNERLELEVPESGEVYVALMNLAGTNYELDISGGLIESSFLPDGSPGPGVTQIGGNLAASSERLILKLTRSGAGMIGISLQSPHVPSGNPSADPPPESGNGRGSPTDSSVVEPPPIEPVEEGTGRTGGSEFE